MISLNLLLSIVLLSLLLVSLVIYYIKSSKNKNKRTAKPKEHGIKVAPSTFKELKVIIKNQETSTPNLEIAVNELMKYYGTIPKKKGVHPAKEFKEYSTLLIAVCRHKNTNAKIVLLFDKQFREKNPSYENNIEEMLQRGLNSRV